MQAGEIVDAAVMRKAALEAFLAEQIADAKAKGVLFSRAPQGHDDEGLRPDHLRPRREGRSSPTSSSSTATSSPPSAPTPTTGLGGVLADAARSCPADTRAEIEEAITATYETRPGAGAWSTRAAASPTCTCRATSSSTPRCRRRSARSGQMWNADDQLQDTKFVIPDSSYAALYDETVEHCQRARRLRPDDDGHDAQRRPHGAEGRGVRQPRQDLRDRRRPAPSASSTSAGTRAARAGRSRRATSSAPARPRTRRSRTGCSSPSRRARATGAPGGVLARRDPRPRRRGAEEGARLPRRARTPTA